MHDVGVEFCNQLGISGVREARIKRGKWAWDRASEHSPCHLERSIPARQPGIAESKDPCSVFALTSSDYPPRF